MRFSVVVPACGHVERLRPALQSMVAAARRGGGETEIVVANDGGAADVSAAVTALAAPEVRELRLPRRGRSAARNAGARQGRGDRLLFLDADVIASAELLPEHRRAAAAAPEALVRGTIVHLRELAAFADPVRGVLTAEAGRSLHRPAGQAAINPTRLLALDPDGLPSDRVRRSGRLSRFERDLHAWLGQRPTDAGDRWVGATGANLSLSRAAFERVGGFDECMGLEWGAEDLEFGYRCERARVPVVHAPNAVVYHMDHPVDADRQAHHRRALRYFAAKHGDPRVLALQDYFFGSTSLTEVLRP